MASEAQKSSFIILLDKIICIRTWGLILYGALPSNLALLGALNIKVEINRTDEFFLFFPACILPIIITFFLIRLRNKSWYLTTDFLSLRSVICTLLILILATFICLFSLIIHSESNIELSEYFTINELKEIAPQAFLLAVVSLVVSSTLFITVLTKNVNLPGLPSVDFVEILAKIRNNLRKLVSSKVWEEYVSIDENGLISLAEGIRKNIDDAAACTGNNLAKKSLVPIRKDIITLINVFREINSSGAVEAKQAKWKLYFASLDILSDHEKEHRSAKEEKVISLYRLKKLKIGDKNA